VVRPGSRGSLRADRRANDVFDARFSATLPGGEDALHFTAGMGLAFSPRFELNLAGDVTSRRVTFSSSFIYRF
jgi:hypothetical protein